MKYNIIRLDEADSTNAVLKKMNAPEGTVVIAKSQTGGYGRRGRGFCSPEGGLYMSAVLCADSVSDRLFIPVRAAAAVFSALAKHLPCGIKWPNDIVARRKKLCGIVAESAGEKVIVGIGVNVNTPTDYFAANGLPFAASMYSLTGIKYNIDAVLNDILLELGKQTERCKALQLYRENCVTVGRDVIVIQGDTEYNAKAVDLTENGELVILRDGQKSIINSGEVSIRGSEYI